jgi:hypothetical protein
LEKPWIIFNFKNDEHIDSIPYTQEIGFDYIPAKRDRGVFIIRPLPSDMRRPRPGELSPLEKFFWQLWARENIGIFLDEGFMVGVNNDGFDSNLTQGRSKRIPMIICTQRPAWISRFCFSEASFIQVFDMTDDRDILTVEGFVPLDWNRETPLKDHQSWYYKVSNKQLVRFNPCPNMDETLKVFEKKLHRKWWRI